MFKDSPFAEIEIVSDEPVIKGQRITGLKLDPVREKFYDMRSMAPNNPNSWQEANLFYRQGKFMEGFTDDYDHFEPLRMFSPCYQRMGYDQLRTFFTWRAQARQGIYPETSVSYVFLHVYELLSGIGSRGPVDGVNKLLALWNAYREEFPVLDDYLPGWLMDYHIYYKMPHSFVEFMETRGLHKYYRELTMFNPTPETTLDDWLAVGTYDISKSRFYKDGNQELMSLAFHKAVEAMQQRFVNLGKSMEDMFYYRSSRMTWKPFDGAVFHPWHKQADREVTLSSYKIYKCANNKWTTHKLIPYKHKDELTGYFVKDMEQHLRKIVDFKGSFMVAVNKLTVADTIIAGMGTSLAELSKLFENIAKEVHYELTRVVVTVDRHNIERIREEADVIQDKLIVDEAADKKENVWTARDHLPVEEFVEEMPAATAVTVPGSNNPWAALKNLLTNVELDALKWALVDPGNVKSFADENGVMLEILADGINEKAMDAIGDNILELHDTIVIYDEYVAEVQSMF